MSQHLGDSGQRVLADQEDASVNGLRGAGPEDHGTAPPDDLATPGSSGASATPGSDGARGAPGSDDATLRALDALSGALAELRRDTQLLEGRLQDLRRRRSEGRAWRDILGDEEAPGAMQVVSRMLACLAKASGTLRKELVDSLRREGASIPAIAKLFGVTHQRISNLLRRTPE
ncbi:MAG: hypothetical protein M0Z40_13820 [Actinomycetota bacterium]|nr:hypothetical protein [Actinomycetota bacterium]MDA8317563.1 hypothetical protein [Actinomycetota bacterium]